MTATTFPRSIRYVRDGTLPFRTQFPLPHSISPTPIPRKVPSYIPAPRSRPSPEPLFTEKRGIVEPLSVSNVEGRKFSLPMSTEGQPSRLIKPYEIYTGDRGGIMTFGHEAPANLESYPHSYYPFKRGGVEFGDAINKEKPLQELMQERTRGRSRSPSYIRAMQELGGIEDTIEGISHE